MTRTRRFGLGAKLAVAVLAPLLLFAIVEATLAVGFALFVRPPERAPVDAPHAGGGASRVLVLGDSFSYGLYLPPPQSYPAQLRDIVEREHHTRLQIINAAQPGRSPSMIGHDLDKVLDATQPERVLLLAGFNINDADIERYRDATGKGVPGLRGAMLRTRVLLSHLRSYQVLRNAVLRWMPRADDFLQVDPSMKQFDFRLYQEINAWALDHLIGALVARGVDVVVLNYPQAPVPDNAVGEQREYYYVIFMRQAKPLTREDFLFERRPGEMAINAMIRSIAGKHRVPLVDNFTAFERHPARTSLFLPGDEHPNAEGYRLMAETTARVLAAHWHLPPP